MLGPHSLAQWPALVGHTSLHSIRRAKVAMAFHKSAVLQLWQTTKSLKPRFSKICLQTRANTIQMTITYWRPQISFSLR